MDVPVSVQPQKKKICVIAYRGADRHAKSLLSGWFPTHQQFSETEEYTRACDQHVLEFNQRISASTEVLYKGGKKYVTVDGKQYTDYVLDRNEYVIYFLNCDDEHPIQGWGLRGNDDEIFLGPHAAKFAQVEAVFIVAPAVDALVIAEELKKHVGVLKGKAFRFYSPDTYVLGWRDSNSDKTGLGEIWSSVSTDAKSCGSGEMTQEIKQAVEKSDVAVKIPPVSAAQPLSASSLAVAAPSQDLANKNKKVCVLAESKYKTAYEFLKTWFPDKADKEFLYRSDYVAYFLNYEEAADEPCEALTWNPQKDTQQIIQAFKGTLAGRQADAFHEIVDYPEAVKHAKQLQPDDFEGSDLIKKIAQADVIFIVASRRMKRDIASILSINEKHLLEKKPTRKIFSWQDKQQRNPHDQGEKLLVDQADAFLRSILDSKNHMECTWFVETDKQLTEKFNHAMGREIEVAKAPAAAISAQAKTPATVPAVQPLAVSQPQPEIAAVVLAVLGDSTYAALKPCFPNDSVFSPENKNKCVAYFLNDKGEPAGTILDSGPEEPNLGVFNSLFIEQRIEKFVDTHAGRIAQASGIYVVGLQSHNRQFAEGFVSEKHKAAFAGKAFYICNTDAVSEINPRHQEVTAFAELSSGEVQCIEPSELKQKLTGKNDVAAVTVSPSIPATPAQPPTTSSATAAEVSAPAAAVPTVQPSSASGSAVAPRSQTLANQKVCVIYDNTVGLGSAIRDYFLDVWFPTTIVSIRERQRLAFFSNPKDRNNSTVYLQLQGEHWFSEESDFKTEIAGTQFVFILSMNPINILQKLAENAVAYGTENKEIYVMDNMPGFENGVQTVFGDHFKRTTSIEFTRGSFKFLTTVFGNAIGRTIEAASAPAAAVVPATAAAVSAQPPEGDVPLYPLSAPQTGNKVCVIAETADHRTRLLLQNWFPDEEQFLKANPYVLFYLNYKKDEPRESWSLMGDDLKSALRFYVRGIGQAGAVFIFGSVQGKLKIIAGLAENGISDAAANLHYASMGSDESVGKEFEEMTGITGPAVKVAPGPGVGSKLLAPTRPSTCRALFFAGSGAVAFAGAGLTGLGMMGVLTLSPAMTIALIAVSATAAVIFLALLASYLVKCNQRRHAFVKLE